MLQSAMDNLRDMAYFGIMEYQLESQRLFEATFNLKFKDNFVQYDSGYASDYNLNESQKQIVLSRNELDIRLYEYAEQLFLSRVRSLDPPK